MKEHLRYLKLVKFFKKELEINLKDAKCEFEYELREHFISDFTINIYSRFIFKNLINYLIENNFSDFLLSYGVLENRDKVQLVIY